MKHSFSTPETVRLDKWLWAARFYKTRSIATQAIDGGKVHINGQRCKPSRNVNINDRLEIYFSHGRTEIIVHALSNQRGPASIAMQLYTETEASLAERAKQKELYRLNALSMPIRRYQASRKDKRIMVQLKRGYE